MTNPTPGADRLESMLGAYTDALEAGRMEDYPSASNYARRAYGFHNASGSLPGKATNAQPGSPEKIVMLTARAEAGDSRPSWTK